MADSYQAIYDAVRSRISNGDIGGAVRDAAFQQFDISYAKEGVTQQLIACAGGVAAEMSRPSVLFRPTLSADGTSWLALLGENIQVGVCGFGDTPSEAMADFDRAFRNDRTPAATRKLKDAQ